MEAQRQACISLGVFGSCEVGEIKADVVKKFPSLLLLG
jgi:hypothetical protein